ncbi:MAG: membrane protein insertase YidC [Ignavibacteria bacterium]|nr:membrane protein insertase YidC [Ignavibacteria bacterium]
MDKKSIIGFILIGVILIVWVYIMSQQKPKPQIDKPKTEITQKDSLKQDTVKKDSLKSEVKKDTLDINAKLLEKYGKLFFNLSVEYSKADSNAIGEKIIIVENDKVYMEFTNYGGALRKYIVKGFKKWDGDIIQLIDWNAQKELSLFFTSKDGKNIHSKDLVFTCNYNPWQKVNIENEKEFKLIYSLIINSDSSQVIRKIYTFNPSSYEFDVKYELLNSDKYISNDYYEVTWGSSLNLTEYRSDEEATFAEAYAYMGGEITTLTAERFDSYNEKKISGSTDYVSSRNKYFGVFIIPLSRKGDGAFLRGKKEKLKDEGVRNMYEIAVRMDIKNEKLDTASFQIIITPIDYKILKSYNKELELTMRFPLDFIVRPIAQYFIIPFFLFLHSFIPNYGIVIIIFAIVLKILLNPLTKKQMESMKRMGKLSPKINKIREKYKDDPNKANAQIMKLYREEKINPAGGCLPLLLQLPILYALFAVFRSTIELRQAYFFWWIKDLSTPDVILTLPFKIPIFGINQIAGVATLMGITMFIQQKMTVTDPKQKMMVYLMPILLTFLFYSFPAGLNLYYFVFNLLSIGQQIYNTKFKKEEPEEEKPKNELKKKKSFMDRVSEYAEKKAKQTRRR